MSDEAYSILQTVDDKGKLMPSSSVVRPLLEIAGAAGRHEECHGDSPSQVEVIVEARLHSTQSTTHCHFVQADSVSGESLSCRGFSHYTSGVPRMPNELLELYLVREAKVDNVPLIADDGVCIRCLALGPSQGCPNTKRNSDYNSYRLEDCIEGDNIAPVTLADNAMNCRL